MYKKILSLFLLVLASLSLVAQDQTKWSYSFEPTNAKVGDKGFLVLKVTVKEPWHIYGTEDECDGNGPILTTLKLKTKEGFTTEGKLQAIGAKTHFDENFGCDVSQFEKTALYKQPITFVGESLKASGTVDFMVCQIGQCIPFFEEPFQASGKVQPATKIEKVDPEVKDEKKDDNNTSETSIKEPDTQKPDKTVPEDKPEISVVVVKAEDTSNSISVEIVNTTASENGEGCDIERKAGWDDIIVNRFDVGKKESDFSDLLLALIGAFLAGLITVVTPCVFPMLPMTVTFFTKSNKTRSGAITQALIYGFSIVAIYTFFGVIVGRVAGEEFASWLSTNPWVNASFFVLFIVFALSFLGMFEITLPNGLVNKVDAQSDKGGLVGTFFMAFALVLVSFSCTGPIVGSILILSAQGDWLVPTLTMLSFSVAFALPFTITALFPSLLSKLPKSGGWLNSVKVVLGLLEIALSLKFLSQVDQKLSLGVLDREVFLVIWIAVFVVLAIYLFGKIRFSHDDPIEKISAPRGAIGIASLAFAIYLIPGLWGAPLKSLSGLLPPMSTQDFVLGVEKYEGDYLCEEPLYLDSELHMPHQIKGYFDLRQAICCAKEQRKPLFIDFTGKTCANCRQIEEQVWSDPAVLELLREEFVVVSLYTDYNLIELPKSEHYTSKSGREITTLGKSLHDFQKEKYDALSSPMYSIVGYDSKNSTKESIVLEELTGTYAYDKDIKAYTKFLKKGIKAYKELNKESK